MLRMCARLTPVGPPSFVGVAAPPFASTAANIGCPFAQGTSLKEVKLGAFPSNEGVRVDGGGADTRGESARGRGSSDDPR